MAVALAVLVAQVEAAAPVGETISLYYDTTASYVTVDSSAGGQLEAKGITSAGPLEKFIVEDAGGSNILLKAAIHGQCVRVDTSDSDIMKAGAASDSGPLYEIYLA